MCWKCRPAYKVFITDCLILYLYTFSTAPTSAYAESISPTQVLVLANSRNGITHCSSQYICNICTGNTYECSEISKIVCIS